MKNGFKVLLTSAKLALIGVIAAACFTLTACDPSHFYFEEEDLSDVVSIELINYDNPKQKEFSSWVPDHSSDLKPFDESKVTVLETLDESEIPDFTAKLCEPIILYWYFAYDSPNGICIKLTYSTGDFLIVWSDYQNGWFGGYIGKFTSEGEVKEFYGSFASLGSYTYLVNNYFETQI